MSGRSTKKLQYTIRNIPSRVDRTLRKRSRASGLSFNQVALEALLIGSGESVQDHHDLDFMIGTLSQAEVRELDREIAAQRRVDPRLWK